MFQTSQSLYLAAQVRELDRIAIDEFDILGQELMERAGRAALSFLLARWPRARHITCLCGSGNNGGDAYVLARLAHEMGLSVVLYAVEQARSDTAGQACSRYLAVGGTVHDYLAGSLLSHTDVVVDGLLGTGLERPVQGVYLEAVKSINAADAPCLALDIPSGLHADTGRVMDAAVRADATISFIGHKLGVWTGRGRELAGTIGFSGLSVPPAVYRTVTPAARRIMPEQDGLYLPARARDSHKGNSGRVLVVGGDIGMPGAAALCGVGAYRAGAGLVTLATQPQHAARFVANAPEMITRGISTREQLSPLLAHADVVAIGPGLGSGDWARGLLARVLEWRGPLVVDADALNLLSSDPVKREDWVLTPHPGEAARLLECSTAVIQDDRPAAVRDLVQRYGGMVVLKGAGTLVDDGADLWLCDAGNPGMASGGMGDVLTGVIAALIAQGHSLSAAARFGVWLHASAADDAVNSQGERGLLASDLGPFIRQRSRS